MVCHSWKQAKKNTNDKTKKKTRDFKSTYVYVNVLIHSSHEQQGQGFLLHFPMLFGQNTKNTL